MDFYSSALFLSFLIVCCFFFCLHASIVTDHIHSLCSDLSLFPSFFHVTTECVYMAEMTFSVQAIRENEKTVSVLHMHAHWGVVVIWKYVNFKPDDITQAPDNENYAWGILVSLTVIRWRWSLMHLSVSFEPYTLSVISTLHIP